MDKQLNEEVKKQGVRSDVGTLTTAHSKDKLMKTGAESLSWGYDTKTVSLRLLDSLFFFKISFTSKSLTEGRGR